MKRDNDYIRELLFELEADETWMQVLLKPNKPTPEEQKKMYHLHLMADAGLVDQMSNSSNSLSFRLTNCGHDFLESTRDDGIWQDTKVAVRGAGGAALGLIGDVASALVRKKMSEYLGINL